MNAKAIFCRRWDLRAKQLDTVEVTDVLVDRYAVVDVPAKLPNALIDVTIRFPHISPLRLELIETGF
jgi:hypothetical protein